MIKFQTENIVRNIIGDGNLLPALPRRFQKFRIRERFVVATIFTIPMHSIQLLTAINFVFNIRKDLISACTSSIVVLSFLCILAIYWHYFINRERFYSLFNDVEDIIRKSVCERPLFFSHCCESVYVLLIQSINCRDEIGSKPGNLHKNGAKRKILFECGFVCFCRNPRYAFKSIHISGISLDPGKVQHRLMDFFLSSLVIERGLYSVASLSFHVFVTCFF